MPAKLNLWYTKRRNIINLTKYILLAIILLYLAWLIDFRLPNIKRMIPSTLLLDADISETFLANLSGVFLSITTFSFTTILTVLNIYNSNYSSRLLQNFIDKPIVLNVLGTFIGGFFYSLFSLFMIRQTVFDHKIVTGSFGILYALFSMFNFIRFVQEVIRDLKSTNIVEDGYRKARKLVEEELERREQSRPLTGEAIGFEQKIYAHNTGYLHSFDCKRILRLLADSPGELLIQAHIGTYIVEGQYIALLRVPPNSNLNKDETADLCGEISDCFFFDVEQNDLQDYRGAMENLIEIGIRVLSSGINDPGTAIQSIRKLCQLLGRLFSTDSPVALLAQTNQVEILYSNYSPEEELYLTFDQIIHYAAPTPRVMAAILEGLQVTDLMAGRAGSLATRAFFDEVYELASEQTSRPSDLKRLEYIKNCFYHDHNFADKEAMQDA